MASKKRREFLLCVKRLAKTHLRQPPPRLQEHTSSRAIYEQVVPPNRQTGSLKASSLPLYQCAPVPKCPRKASISSVITVLSQLSCDSLLMNSCSTLIDRDVDEEIREGIEESSRTVTPPPTQSKVQPMPLPEAAVTREALSRQTVRMNSLLGLWRSKVPHTAPFVPALEPSGPVTPWPKADWKGWTGSDDRKSRKRPCEHKVKMTNRATLEGKVMQMISYRECEHMTFEKGCKECEGAAEVEDWGY
jgi:hypothetical protein